MKAIGYLIKCMAMGDTHGKMAEAMKDNTIMIKNMGMGFTHGQMARNMRGTGWMGKGTAKANILIKKEQCKKEYGKMIKKLTDCIFAYSVLCLVPDK